MSKINYESDPRPFGDLLKVWHATLNLTRDQAAAELRVSRGTYDSWCSGRGCSLEGAIRRLMQMIA